MKYLEITGARAFSVFALVASLSKELA